MSEKDLMHLVKEAQHKNPDAFAELINLHTKDMYKVSYAILMNDEDVADAIQDTILACWEKIYTLKKPKYFKTWLTRILINKCCDIRRSNNRTVSLECTGEIEAQDPATIEFKGALSMLDEKYRTVVVLHYSEGYRTDEIAKMLNIPRNTVLTRLARARDKLSDYFGTHK